MTKQLSDCCKAGIKLTGKDRPNAFACEKCGRTIGKLIMTEAWEKEFDKDFDIRDGLPDGYSDWDNVYHALKAFISSKLHTAIQQERDGDLLSNCCAWDFEPLGVEKEPGVYQERCLKCHKLCEPLYIGLNDIKNIRRLSSLE